MLAPAELPSITPPRFNTFRSSRSTRVPKYASANRHCRPPSMNTNVACFNGATNSAESAFTRSFCVKYRHVLNAEDLF